MLLRFLALTTTLTLAIHASAFAAPVAPADEYFGPFKVSILEIRNRLAVFERDNGVHLHANVLAIDNVELAIEDWYMKYPADPWIRGFSARLVRVYVKASAATTVRCAKVSRIATLTSFIRR